jgi:methionyl-tRNA formyltransferase
MKIIFFGTPEFAANILCYLLENKVNVVAIVTQPDKEKGRSSNKRITVKDVAKKSCPNIPLYQPNNASDAGFLNQIRQHNADLFVVVAYGKILKQSLLDLPKLDTINVHASLLPKYRGAAPIQRSLLNGDEETGITIMKIAPELDAGDIISMKKLSISSTMNGKELETALCDLSKPLLLDVIKNFSIGNVEYLPQDDSKSTYASKIEANDKKIFWDKPAKQIHNLIRAFSPFPGAECLFSINGLTKRLKVKKSLVVPHSGYPGEILFFEKDLFIVACKENALQLLEVQLEGKKKMPIKDFIHGIKGEISFIPYS